MIFGELIDDRTQYASRDSVLKELLAEDGVPAVFYPEIVPDLIKSTRPLRCLEMLLGFGAVMCLVFLMVELFIDRTFPSGAFFIFALAAFSAVIFSILSLRRSELTDDIILQRSSDKVKVAVVLKYFNNLRNSHLPLGKLTSGGLQKVGRLHLADGGLLTLLGNPKQRVGIRKFNMGWGELYFPKPELFERRKVDTSKNQTMNIQKRVLRIDSKNDALALVELMKSFAQHDHKPNHVAWFEFLHSTIHYRDVLDGKTRHQKVIEDLAKRTVAINSTETCRRIAQTKSYPDLEKHLPSYLKRAEKAGNQIAKTLLLELPEDS